MLSQAGQARLSEELSRACALLSEPYDTASFQDVLQAVLEPAAEAGAAVARFVLG